MKHSKLTLAAALIAVLIITGSTLAFPLPESRAADVSAARTPQELANMTVLGVHSHNWAQTATILSTAELGQMRNARIDIPWVTCEPSQDAYDWRSIDAEVNQVLADGMQTILFNVGFPVPGWAQGTTAVEHPDLAPPANILDWKDFCGAVAARYKDKVDFYEIWNEPGWDIDSEAWQKSSTVYFEGQVETDYLPMLQAAYAAIKANDPSSYVICGALNYSVDPYDLNKQATLYRTLFDDVNRAGLENSMKITSDQPVIAERPMYFNYKGLWSGGHDVMGATSSRTEWYFAEGTTRENFEEYLCLQNPGSTAATVTVNYMIGGGQGNQTGSYKVNPYSRFTLRVNDIIGPDKDVSMKVTSTRPIIAERPIYFNYMGAWTGGHDVMGAGAPQKDWYFAEGTTRQGFDEYLCLQNPNAGATSVNVNFMTGTGENVQVPVTLAPQSRSTLWVNQVLGPEKDVSIWVSSTGDPIVAERPMYFAYRPADLAWTGGHDVVGANATSKQWYFAEGTTRQGFDEYLCLQNPNADATTVNVSFMTSTGQNIPLDFSIAARSRFTVWVNQAVGPDADVSMQVSSSEPIIAERPMYFAYQGRLTGGHDVLGAASAGKQWYFAEGYAGSAFEQYLCLQNPGSTAANVNITYMMKNGDNIAGSIVVPARTRSTVNVNAVLGYRSFCDAVAVHPYVSPENWGNFCAVTNATLAANGVAKELVATEIGWPHKKDNPGEAPYYSPEGQRSALAEGGMATLFGAGVKKIWVYEDIDDPAGTAWEGAYYGLFYADGTATPAWSAYLGWQSQIP